MYREIRISENESFGDFCYRMGPQTLKLYVDAVNTNENDKVQNILKESKVKLAPENIYSGDFIGGIADAKYIDLVNA